MERIRVMLAKVAVDAANGEVHFAQLPRCRIRLLPVHRDIPDAPLMFLYKLLALNKHASRPATGVVYTALKRLNHLDEQANNAIRGIELASVFAFRAGEFVV